MRFSNRYKSFEKWLSTQDKRIGYVSRITRLHSLYPGASLEQLRGHARIKVEPEPAYTRAVHNLSSRELHARLDSLEVLSLARRTNRSLSGLCKELKISVSRVLRATNGFKKVKGRWRAKKFDKISRVLLINENGREIFIEVRDSRYASIIGKYHAAVKEYLETGNLEALAEFKGTLVRDGSGNYHILETDPNTIRDIYERREDSEFHEDIYGGLNETV